VSISATNLLCSIEQHLLFFVLISLAMSSPLFANRGRSGYATPGAPRRSELHR